MEPPIKILRDCDSTLIPSGDKITLIHGTLVRITQALGGDYTLYVNGNLVKISGRDADAIGRGSRRFYKKYYYNENIARSLYGSSLKLVMIQKFL